MTGSDAVDEADEDDEEEDEEADDDLALTGACSLDCCFISSIDTSGNFSKSIDDASSYV